MAHPVAIDKPELPATRPTGVTVLAVLAVIGAVFAFFAGLAAMAIGAVAGSMGGGELGIFAVFGAIAGFALIAYAVFSAATAWGLWTRKKWAWFASVVLAGLQILGGLGSLASFELFSAIWNLAIGGIIVWYLFSPQVQAWFETSYNVPWTYK